jgi:hypothetical protein
VTDNNTEATLACPDGPVTQENPEPQNPGIAEGTEENCVPAKERRLKRTLTRISVLVVFILILYIGLTVLLYPTVSNYINEKNQSRILISMMTILRLCPLPTMKDT